jgi:hypothetical protein
MEMTGQERRTWLSQIRRIQQTERIAREEATWRQAERLIALREQAEE